jgi:hypothetical protein
LACSSGKPPDNEYLITWRSDPKACGDKRAGILEKVLASRQDLLALDEFAIVEALGKPDENELFKRNQKFYYYYVTPGPACGGDFSAVEKLVIRFNAVGLAKEMYIE